MSEPTGVLTFEDLVKRVAREAGIAYYGSTGQERNMIPIDVHDLDKCKEVVNDGIRMFISDAPPTGWRWMRRIASVTMTVTRVTGTADAADADDSNPATATTLTDATLEDTYDTDDDLVGWWIYILTGTGASSYAQITDYTASGGVVEVADWLDENGNLSGTYPVATDTFAITPIETVGGDISRYPLPENFGGDPAGRIEYAGSTNHASVINWCDEALIRAKRAVTIITGYPRYAAIRSLEPTSNTLSPKRRFEIIFDPQPVAADTVEFPYSLYFDNLSIEAGTATGGAPLATTLTDTALIGFFPNDYFNGWKMEIISGTGRTSYALVTDYVSATGVLTIADWLFADGTAGGTDGAASSIYVLTPANNLHPAGYRFDEFILAACMAKAEMEFEDISANYVEQYHKKSLREAYKIDARSAPRQLGSMNPGRRYVRERTWSDITYS